MQKLTQNKSTTKYQNRELPGKDGAPLALDRVEDYLPNLAANGGGSSGGDAEGNSREIIRLPVSICRELLGYAERKNIRSGPIFRTRDGMPISRNNVTISIRQLCVAAGVPEEKGSPRCLRKLYQSTRAGIERSISLLIDQAQDRLLEEEQLTVGWGNG